ncbi:hypothetical protein [Methylobacter sp. YRD-M1]|uniref:hypothetical protein n=1 Tax=Methylobacter sp. YRD-M1 TaxID=2911520 RepID=UPI00227C3E08|nr:hypothetical protein [Methylobacter sp. YRD-M1]WAK00970.1 hypothetical protein LZ558_14125 [Methylobacter sp. YRD-M1]
MFLSAAPRHIIRLPLVFLLGVWVGQSWLNDRQPDGQDKSEEIKTWSKSEQRTPFTAGGKITAKSEDTCMDRSGNSPGREPPAQDFPDDRTDMIASYNEGSSESSLQAESYSFHLSAALESSAAEPSPQSIENDIGKSLEEAGISPEEIPGRVDNMMEMILQNDQQTPAEAYPDIPPDTDVPGTD